MKHFNLLCLAMIAIVAACDSGATGQTSSSATSQIAVSPESTPAGSTVDKVEPSLQAPASSAEIDSGPSSTTSELTVSLPASVYEAQDALATNEVRLWVSNQSFEDDPVAITIRVDDEIIVDKSFFVEGQHNWMSVDIAGLDPGDHNIVAVSDTGALIEESFTLPDGESRWLVVDYWFYPDEGLGRYFAFLESDVPVGFA